MTRKFENEVVDIVIVGAGAAGGVLAKELAEKGLSVVLLEAGPLRDPQKDYASDELAMQRLGWQDTRIVDGADPLTMGHNNSGYGVGGGTNHWTGVFLRFHEADFRARSFDDVAWDWPISYEDLAPYYDKIERDIAVSGPKKFPWGNYHGPYPYPEREPLSPNAYVFQRGCAALNIETVVTPLAILSAPFEDRPPCINRGFCNQGCMPNAKYSSLIVHVPKAIRAGAELLPDSMVTRILMSKDGRAEGVEFYRQGAYHKQRARVVIVSAYAVETPRLLLNSSNARFPDGLANSSGWVGRALMTHSSHDVYAKFEEEIRLYKGTPVLSTTQEFYRSNPEAGYVRGYTLHAHGARPVAFMNSISKSSQGPIWGQRLREIALDYNYYGRVTMVGEVLPNPDNRVTLSNELDSLGLPRAKVHFSYGENDLKLISHAESMMSSILRAAGGTPEFTVPDTAHLMGGCRMGDDPDSSVVNSYGRTHDIPNLYVCDASIFVTSGAGNPTNTVMSLAARTADHLIEQLRLRDL